jgi:methylenetetrahydrofolate--tRNA-(uracil-5-)-methyltransferase
MATARRFPVPAGAALAVDRQEFSSAITRTLEDEPLIEIRRSEVAKLPEGHAVLATGPLTSDALAHELAQLLGEDHLHFYDAIAPIVDAESLGKGSLFWASRYGKGDEAAYLNSPLDKATYLAFRQALVEAEMFPLHEFEEPHFFEGCLPVEELARRGEDTLRFGPLKPVGLEDPEGREPYAVVQLRREDLAGDYFNLVGFQTRLRYPEQDRVFRLLPGLEKAVFVRHGQVHRNTFIKAPLHLDLNYRLKERPRLRLAGQITGVEGYLESAATGLLVGLYMALELEGKTLPEPLPFTTALGALGRHLTRTDPDLFQPSNVHFGLFQPLHPRPPKRERRQRMAARAREDLQVWARVHGLETRVT